MKQVVQATSGGAVEVADVPVPEIGATEVLVRSQVTSMSPGTEGAMTRLAQSSLASKARARPDLVKQVLDKARKDGLRDTVNAVRARLDGLMPLGYSGAGLAVEVGEAVAHIRPGMLVATGGAGKANHAEYQAVPGNLCVPVPHGVSAEDASMSTIAAIAQHGLRQADLESGEFVAVIGVGLLGRITMRLARVAGLFPFGIDVSEGALDPLAGEGMPGAIDGPQVVEKVLEWSHGRGADAVIITAAAKDSTAIERAITLCRDRATIVVVGDVGLELDRRPFYDAELSLRFARSYGPGRYDRSFEDWGVDYPIGHVRWTEQRNMESVLDHLDSGRLQLSDLVTHRFEIEAAANAYEMVSSRSEPYLGIQLTYPDPPGEPRRPALQGKRRRTTSTSPGLGLIGAGTFTRGVLLPSMQTAGFERLVAVASASGLSAYHLAQRTGAEKGAVTVDDLLADPDVEVVCISTPHETHAELVVRALRAGKHVFCEKPLALTFDELSDVAEAAETSDRHLFAGFNRRWSPSFMEARDHLSGSLGPFVITYRVSAGKFPDGHWYGDRRQGGRLIGEVCHFIDTCQALVGEQASHVTASASGAGERLLSDDFVVSLTFPNGSLAVVSYASAGHAATPKERVEILGRNRTAIIDDYRSVELDGKAHGLRGQDKGHVSECAAFLSLITGRSEEGNDGLSAMQSTLLAADSLREAFS